MANASAQLSGIGVRSRWLLRSDADVRATLARMRHLVEKATFTQNFVYWARQEIARTGADSRTPSSVAYAVRDYVKRHIQFMPDPVGQDNLTPPLDHMELIKANPQRPLLGDCDDAATLSAAMAGVAGIPSTFTVLAFWRPDSPYQHVFTTLYPRGGGPVVCDTTRDEQRLPPTATRRLTVPAIGRV